MGIGAVVHHYMAVSSDRGFLLQNDDIASFSVTEKPLIRWSITGFGAAK
jgi:hypothetical protein